MVVIFIANSLTLHLQLPRSLRGRGTCELSKTYLIPSSKLALPITSVVRAPIQQSHLNYLVNDLVRKIAWLRSPIQNAKTGAVELLRF